MGDVIRNRPIAHSHTSRLGNQRCVPKGTRYTVWPLNSNGCPGCFGAADDGPSVKPVNRIDVAGGVFDVTGVPGRERSAPTATPSVNTASPAISRLSVIQSRVRVIITTDCETSTSAHARLPMRSFDGNGGAPGELMGPPEESEQGPRPRNMKLTENVRSGPPPRLFDFKRTHYCLVCSIRSGRYQGESGCHAPSLGGA